MPISLYLDVSLLAFLLLASLSDLARRRIPNRLIATALCTTVLLHLLLAPPLALLSTVLAGAAVGLSMFLPLYVRGAMAAGDVKLMAAVGAFTGPALAFQISLATYCAGGVLALAIVLAKGRGRIAAANVGALLRPLFLRLGGVPLAREPMPHPSVGGMPYALAITAGSVLMLWIDHSQNFSLALLALGQRPG